MPKPKIRFELTLTPAAALDELLRHEDWQHPTQVLDRPRPEPKALLALCEARLEGAEEPERTRLQDTRHKLERAARIDAEARHNRERLRRREQRLGSGGRRPLRWRKKP
ncbi:MAG: hypothetical protein V3T72_09540 [Thermoanaerobaculia bacterium]